jgi:hypothetical protein
MVGKPLIVMKTMPTDSSLEAPSVGMTVPRSERWCELVARIAASKAERQRQGARWRLSV